MKNIILLFILKITCLNILFAQNIDFFPVMLPKNSLNVTSHTGYGVATANRFKKVMLATGGEMSFERLLRNYYAIKSAVGFNLLRNTHIDNNGNQLLSKVFFGTVTVSAIQYARIGKKVFGFWDIGLSYNNLMLLKEENGSSLAGNDVTKKSIGSSISVNFNMGVKFDVANQVFFKVGIGGLEDILHFYPNDANKIKLKTNCLVFEISYPFN